MGPTGGTHNALCIHPCVASGACAEYVYPGDVCMELMDIAGHAVDASSDVARTANGEFQLHYTVHESYSLAACMYGLRLRVSVCGIVLVSDATVQPAYDALNGDHLVTSYDVGYGDKLWMTVSPDGSLLAISFVNACNICIFQMVPAFKLLRVHQWRDF